MKISAVSEHQCHLGEGPLWDPRGEVLYWVDSLGPVLYWLDFRHGRVRHCELPGETIGSVAVREKGGLILAMDQGFYTFSPQFLKAEPIALPLAGRHGIRFNDGKVDPFGHFVSGAMNIDFDRAVNCPMYRLTPEHEVIEILDGFMCFNGPCFGEDGKYLYVTGRGDYTAIEVFDYGDEQIPRNGKPLLECNPDGATVDAEGYIWSAQWTEACILRIAPDGEIAGQIDIPNQIVSSVMFGGPDLDLIYVTTIGREVLGDMPRGEKPGRTLVIEDSGYRGRPEPMFRG